MSLGNKTTILPPMLSTFLLVLLVLIITIYSIYTLVPVLFFHSAPYIRSNKARINTMLELADIKPGMRVIDIGSGDGEICLHAAKRGANALGIELNPFLVLLSRIRSRTLGVSHQTRFVSKNFWQFKLPIETDVVLCYLRPHVMQELWPKLIADLHPGTIIISNSFYIPQVEPEKEKDGVMRYRIPE